MVKHDAHVKKYKTRLAAAKYYEANKEAVAARKQTYRLANKESRARAAREYRANNKEAVAAHQRVYFNANRDAVKAQQKEYRAANKEAIALNKKAYRHKNATYFMARQTLSRLLGDVFIELKAGITINDAEKVSGYANAELVSHLESLFTEGMTWDNHGEWHIDHIKPVAAFKAEGITDISVINALSNLQPLWAVDNLRKGAKS